MNMPAENAFFYFAYGSNLKLSEIHRSCTNAERHRKAVLPNHALVFPRRSINRKCGVASVDGREGEQVWGGIYVIPKNELGSLEEREGFRSDRNRDENSYFPGSVTVFVDGDLSAPLEVMTFIANRQASPPLPNKEYKDLIIAGAEEWELPSDYISALRAIATCQP